MPTYSTDYSPPTLLSFFPSPAIHWLYIFSLSSSAITTFLFIILRNTEAKYILLDFNILSFVALQVTIPYTELKSYLVKRILNWVINFIGVVVYSVTMIENNSPSVVIAINSYCALIFTFINLWKYIRLYFDKNSSNEIELSTVCRQNDGIGGDGDKFDDVDNHNIHQEVAYDVTGSIEEVIDGVGDAIGYTFDSFTGGITSGRDNHISSTINSRVVSNAGSSFSNGSNGSSGVGIAGSAVGSAIVDSDCNEVEYGSGAVVGDNESLEYF